ncbi:hypothetical protein [Pendulispora albinea]|uniref:Uncharacterized protein n=1 Tax=Pendulispora albinea TaxID=2741071 RepID=A0ABZ2LZF5_9BACT
MNSKWTWSGGIVVGLMVAACGSSGGDGSTGNGGPGEEGNPPNVNGESPKPETAWDCGAKGSDRIVCTSAMTVGQGDKNKMDQYVCKAGEKSAKCPDSESVRVATGANRVLDTSVRTSTFDQLPWACMTTGAHQVQCARDLSLMNPAGCDGCGPKQPTTCDEKAWEDYFVPLSAKVYKNFGFDIDFPRETFNAHELKIDLSGMFQGSIMTPNVPSCYAAEWALRAEAWIRAVSHGCVNLTLPILIWCQQAANYAPNTKQCNATGSWAGK